MGSGVTFAGRQRIIPGAYSQVYARTLSPRGGAGRTVAILGQATGGAPLSVLTFYTPAEARAALRGGALLDGCMMAWHPAPDVAGADKIIAIRTATTCLRGTANLLKSGDACIGLTTRDYGAWVNAIRYKVEAASNVATYAGLKRITVENQDEPNVFEIGDDLGKAFTVRYTGAGPSCLLTITVTAGKAVTLATSVPSVTADAISLDLTKPQFDTLQKVVAYLSTLSAYEATLVGDGAMESSKLDPAAAVEIASVSEVHFPAVLNACIDWFNDNSQYIAAARSSTSITGAPDALAWTNFSNGSDGTVDAAAYTAALALLQAERDVAYIAETTGNVSRQAQVLAAVDDLERVYRHRVRAFFGPAASVPLATAKTYAAQLRGRRSSYYYPGPKRADETDTLTTYGGWATGCIAAGMSVGLHLVAALTNKDILAGGVETKLTRDEVEECLLAGICPLEVIPGRGVRIVQGLTTDISGDEFWTEQSNIDIADAIVSGLETMLEDRYVGQFGNSALVQNVLSDTQTWLQSFVDKGVLTGDADNPPFSGIQVALDGGTVQVSYNARIAGSTNYILQTASFALGRKVLVQQ